MAKERRKEYSSNFEAYTGLFNIASKKITQFGHGVDVSHLTGIESQLLALLVDTTQSSYYCVVYSESASGEGNLQISWTTDHSLSNADNGDLRLTNSNGSVSCRGVVSSVALVEKHMFHRFGIPANENEMEIDGSTIGIITSSLEKTIEHHSFSMHAYIEQRLSGHAILNIMNDLTLSEQERVSNYLVGIQMGYFTEEEAALFAPLGFADLRSSTFPIRKAISKILTQIDTMGKTLGYVIDLLAPGYDKRHPSDTPIDKTYR